MRIGIDGRLLLYKLRGIGSYTYNLFKEMSSLYTDNEYILYVNQSSPYCLPEAEYMKIISVLKGNGNFKVVNISSNYDFIWEQILLPIQTKKDNIDILFMPANRAPYFCPCKMAVTVHDMIEIIFLDKYFRNLKGFRGKFYDFRSRLYIKFMYNIVFRKADMVFTVSEFSKADIHSRTGIPLNKIKAVYNSYDKSFHKIGDSKGNYLLCLAGAIEHKNSESILRAYTGIHNDLKKKYKLVVVGKNPELEELASDLGETGIEFKQFLPKDELIELYSRATAFLFLSIYEGFGIPPLEAMACGTAVIASNRTSVPEIVNNSALLVDPQNTAEISSAIENIITDNTLREQLEKSGLERVKDFSWEKSAALHYNTLKAILE